MEPKNEKKRKKTNGRQKVEIKLIENRARLYVTFAKRRKGLFTKVRKLSSSFGVDIAVIIFSPTGRIYSFASPSVDSLINHLFNGDYIPMSSQQPETDGSNGEEGGRFCWDVPIENMDLKELLRHKNSLQEEKKKVCQQAEEMMMMMGSMSHMRYSSINEIVGGTKPHGFSEKKNWKHLSGISP